jgi:uncharacterized membrane protein YkvA (DUF1232 family)
MAGPLAKRPRRPNLSAMSDVPQLVRNEARVRAGFWQKARRTLGRVPFSEDAVAAFYCASDSATPLAVRATLFGALAYFVLPIDAIPDFIPGLGFTDDAALLIGALTAAQMHVTKAHRQQARDWLLKEQAAPGA